MYKFDSKRDKASLDADYRRIYANANLQSKWDTELRKCPELAKTLPRGISPIDVLTMPYMDLVDIYNRYISIYSGLTLTKQSCLNSAAKRVFTYQSYSRAIADFLMDENNEFNIFNCVYCDLVDVRSYDRSGSRRQRQFDIEHILDKGTCPLVGLSLYNFCPACRTCNTLCKGTNPIGNTPKLMKKLSPTSPQYDFENQVKFVLNIIKPEGIGRIRPDHLDWYEVDFDYKDTDYQEIVTMFQLKERYNLDQHKLSAVEWRYKAKKYRGIALALSAVIHGNTMAQEREEIFQYNASLQAHSGKRKLLKDMMTI